MEFTNEQINEVLNSFLGDKAPEFRNVLELTIFISKISKELLSTVKNNSVDRDAKVKVTVDVGRRIIDELEVRGLVTLEMANEVREILTNTETLSDMFSTFMNEVETTSVKSWFNFFSNCMLGFGCNKETKIDEKAHSGKPMTALEAVLSEAEEEVKEVVKPDILETVIEDSGCKIEILEEKPLSIEPVEDVKAEVA